MQAAGHFLEDYPSHYTSLIWVNIGSGNGLLSDGTMQLTKPMLTYNLCSPMTITPGPEIPQPSVTNFSLNITYLKFHSNLTGANELTLYHNAKLPSSAVISVISCQILYSQQTRHRVPVWGVICKFQLWFILVYYLPKFFGKYVRLSVCLLVCPFCQA